MIRKIKALILFLLILGPSLVYGQSSTIAKWSKDKPAIRQLCFYPTTLRMVNINHDKAFNDMIKDIRKLKIILSSNKAGLKKEDIKALQKGVKTEDYKDMIMVKNGKESIHIYIKEKDSQPIGFAGIVNSDSSFFVIDLEGKISPAMIQQLISGNINMEAISKIYDISKIKESNPSHK